MIFVASMRGDAGTGKDATRHPNAGPDPYAEPNSTQILTLDPDPIGIGIVLILSHSLPIMGIVVVPRLHAWLLTDKTLYQKLKYPHLEYIRGDEPSEP